jgi:hypothetical protein
MLLCYPNLIDDATLSSATAWVSTLPLANLQDRRLSVRARTDSVTAAAIDINLGSAKAVWGLALCGHNLTVAATIRVRGSTVANFATTAYDSGSITAWPGITTQTEADGFVGYSPVFTGAELVECRYWRIDVEDSLNPSGYLEVGRVFIGAGWVPQDPPSYGWSIGYEDPTIIESSLGGCEYFDERPKYRILQAGLNYLTPAEYQGDAMGMLRTLGTSGELMLIWDEADTDTHVRGSFLGRLRTLSAIENPNPLKHATALEIREIIA